MKEKRNIITLVKGCCIFQGERGFLQLFGWCQATQDEGRLSPKLYTDLCFHLDNISLA